MTSALISFGSTVLAFILNVAFQLYRDSVPDIGKRRRHRRAFVEWAWKLMVLCVCLLNLFEAFRIQPPITAPKVALIAAAVAFPLFWLLLIFLSWTVVPLHDLSLQRDIEFKEFVHLLRDFVVMINEFNRREFGSDSDTIGALSKSLQENVRITVALFKAFAIIAQKLKMPREARSQIYELLRVEGDGVD